MNMDATHPIRVVLFWDLEHAKDAYGPYFTGAAKKTWTFTRMVTYDELVRKILKHRGMDPNLWRIRMTMRVPSFYEEYQMFNFTLYSMNNDDEMRYIWTIRLDISKEGIHVLVEFEPIQSQIFSEVQHTHYQLMRITKHSSTYDDDNDDADEDSDVSSESNDDNNPNDEEDDIRTPVNPLSSTTVNQWQSSQWFNKAPYDYISSGAFLNMGLGEQIDDLIESNTIRLLDMNDAMTDIQLGMRFVNKIQAISAVQKWSIRIGREFRVVKTSKYNFKIYFKTNIASCCQRSQDPYLERQPRSATITSDKLYVQEAWYDRKFAIERVFDIVVNGKNIHCLVLMIFQSVEIMVQDQMLMY
ncbi:hypothetical protein M9H77_35775 [Catharanthus roseus]|uniref:Uncharacterized protein n=1 Tax=Catharanthus roseus TaxID=4058 RepID=A0ACB9ZQR6_CATRO|nr:hypothetical protein M9H77_35775 [Catharanthus roseus]